jgi:hypothetical protein
LNDQASVLISKFELREIVVHGNIPRIKRGYFRTRVDPGWKADAPRNQDNILNFAERNLF